jgi:hypothetical protein
VATLPPVSSLLPVWAAASITWDATRVAHRASFRVTHWMMPSAPARHSRNPHFLQALSNYGLIRSPLKNENAG